MYTRLRRTSYGSKRALAECLRDFDALRDFAGVNSLAKSFDISESPTTVLLNGI